MIHKPKPKYELTLEYKANEIIERFRASLAKCIENNDVTQILFEVNLSPEGGISRCYLRPQYKIK